MLAALHPPARRALAQAAGTMESVVQSSPQYVRASELMRDSRVEALEEFIRTPVRNQWRALEAERGRYLADARGLDAREAQLSQRSRALGNELKKLPAERVALEDYVGRLQRHDDEWAAFKVSWLGLFRQIQAWQGRLGDFVVHLEATLNAMAVGETQECYWTGFLFPPENGACVYECRVSGRTLIPQGPDRDSPCPWIRGGVPIPRERNESSPGPRVTPVPPAPTPRYTPAQPATSPPYTPAPPAPIPSETPAPPPQPTSAPPANRCGEPCSTPAHGDLDAWCRESCGCNGGYNRRTGRCVP
jgi:hypothetical protein